MVHSVYCYSSEIAKQHHNHATMNNSFMKMVILLLPIVVIFLVAGMYELDAMTTNLLMGVVAVCVILIFVMFFIDSKKLNAQKKAFITDENGELYYISKPNVSGVRGLFAGNGTMSVLPAIYQGQGQTLDESKISDMLTNPNKHEVKVQQVMQLTDLCDNGHAYSATCQLKDITTGKVTTETITVSKAYLHQDDLMDVFESKKG